MTFITADEKTVGTVRGCGRCGADHEPGLPVKKFQRGREPTVTFGTIRVYYRSWTSCPVTGDPIFIGEAWGYSERIT